MGFTVVYGLPLLKSCLTWASCFSVMRDYALLHKLSRYRMLVNTWTQRKTNIVRMTMLYTDLLSLLARINASSQKTTSEQTIWYVDLLPESLARQACFH